MTPAMRIRIGSAVLALSLVAACGLRTPVRPPEDTAPVIPGTPTVTREANATVVRWRRAVRSADDMRLDDLASFVVERKKAGSDAWEPATTIDVIDQEKIRRRNSFAWRDTDASAADASYRVIAVAADGQQGPPNEAVAAAEPVAGAADADSGNASASEAAADAGGGEAAGDASMDAPSSGSVSGSTSEKPGEESPAQKPAGDPVPAPMP